MNTATTTSENVETAASAGTENGQNQDVTTEGADTPPANQTGETPPNGEKPEKPEAPKPEKPKGFKPIETQDELETVLKDRLARQAAKLKADAERQKLESEGEFKQLYTDSQKEVTRLQTEITRLESEITARDEAAAAAKAQAEREKLVASVKAKYALPDKIAELLKGEDAASLEAHAKELADLVGTQPAPPTENGAQPPANKGQAAEAQKRNYSFNVPDGVQW
jgi:translation initiation factor IF-2